jgi:hypothetical protein
MNINYCHNSKNHNKTISRNVLFSSATKTIVGAVVIIIVFWGLIWLSRSSSNIQQANLGYTTGKLLADDSVFNFGEISMASGKVSHLFKIKNAGSEPVVITKLYTSCMCTTAELVIGSKRFGPFGMPGHGFSPRIGQSIGAGESAEILVVFDPAAHGPAGIGPVNRAVYIEEKSGAKLQLGISAVVTP